MEDSTYKQMQDEMSRFEAEISGAEPPLVRAVIGAATYGAVQQRLEQGAATYGTVQQPPPLLHYDPGVGPMVAPRIMFQSIAPPPPPPPPSFIPASVQRHRLPPEEFSFGVGPGPVPCGPGPVPGAPGPQLPPPRPQPAVLSAAPQLYRKTKQDGEKETRKRKRSPPRAALPPPPPPRAPSPPAPTPPAPSAPLPAPTPAPTQGEGTQHKPKKEKKHRKVVRTAGGQVWEDVTLLEWPDDDFRMFCGDLGNDVTDELLTRTFGKYGSFQRAKVVRDRRTNKSRGFGFVSFKEPQDFIKAMKEMDGRYVGSRPIKLRKSTWKTRALDVVRKKEKEKQALLSLLMQGKS